MFDSLSEIRLLAQSPLRYRREVLALKQYFAGRNCTVLLLDDLTGTRADGHLQSIAHGVVTLEKLVPLYGAQRRRLRIAKLRGVDFRGGYHDYVIERGGVVVFPRLVAAEHHHDFERGVASSGDGGAGRDAGRRSRPRDQRAAARPAGNGQVGAGHAVGARPPRPAARRSFIYAFDESIATMKARSKSLGIDLACARKAGRIVIRQIDPAEVPPGQLTHQVRQAVENDGARMVVIDSLNGYLQAMPDESFLVLQLHELLTYLGRQGVVSILVVAQNGLVGASMVSPTDVTYLADTVFLLRHFEAGGTLRKAVSVLKKRTGRHESAIRELRLSDKGDHRGRAADQVPGRAHRRSHLRGSSAEALLDRMRPVAAMADRCLSEHRAAGARALRSRRGARGPGAGARRDARRDLRQTPRRWWRRSARARAPHWWPRRRSAAPVIATLAGDAARTSRPGRTFRSSSSCRARPPRSRTERRWRRSPSSAT